MKVTKGEPASGTTRRWLNFQFSDEWTAIINYNINIFKLGTHHQQVKGRSNGAAPSVVKKKHEWNPMVGDEWMEKHQDIMEGEGRKGNGHQHGW